MKICGRILLVFGLLFCLPRCGPTAMADSLVPALSLVQTTGPFAIAYKFTAGDVKRYSMVFDMNDAITGVPSVSTMNMHVDTTETMTVDSVRPDGAAVTKVDIVNNSALMNGQPMRADALAKMNVPETNMILSTTGQVLSTTQNIGQSPLSSLSDPNSFGAFVFLPPATVNIGDSWTHVSPMNQLGINLNCTMTLKSVELINGVSTAVIETKFSSVPAPVDPSSPPAMTASLSGDTLTTFDVDAGSVESVLGTMSSDVTPQSSAASTSVPPVHVHINMKMTLSRLP